MGLVFINAIPFLLAILGLTPLNRLLSKPMRAWLAAATMLGLFVALLAYVPQLEQRHDALLAQHTSTTETQTHETANTDGTIASDRMVSGITESYEWVPELGLSLTFYLDGLSLVFSLIVTGVGTLVFLYAGYYFDDEAEQIRFLNPFFAFAGAMLGLVLSGNVITLFIMWELTSITSFLLIGFKGGKYESARSGAMQALFITGLGGLALIVGLVLLAVISGDVLNTGAPTFEIAQILTASPEAVAGHPLYVAAVVLLGLAAFTKSAQFPFHFWLPGAMAAPTPASAYLHSATMVKAGVYLLLRMYPPLHGSDFWTLLLVTVGIGTMLIAAFIALWQRDLKGLLAYSTVSWLGALVGMIGLPHAAGIESALVGIIAHALYKAALFLSAGTLDHNTGTRIIDELGGLRKQMPLTATVVVISALSMAGLPIFFGFVAKETLLHAWTHVSFAGQQLSYVAILVSAALTGTAGLIFIWDVFFKEPEHEIHFHHSSIWLSVTPFILAIGTVTFGFLLDPPLTWVEDIVALGVPEAINIHLLPDSLLNPLFLTSLAVIGAGLLVFLLRGWWLPVLSALPLPRMTDLYRLLLRGMDRIGDAAVWTQRGKVRYYLVIILGVVSMMVLATGVVNDFSSGQPIQLRMGDLNAATALRAILLLLIILAAFITVIAPKHLTATLGLGVLGYAVGGLFLIEPAPDVSLVQFLVETLATVLVVIILGRISTPLRRAAMDKLWKGNTRIGDVDVGIYRDLIISISVGLAIFFFALTALANRPDRESITVYHLQNAYTELGIEDVVGAIVADYRGMDTVIELTVFSVAALGVLTLLTRGRSQVNPFAPNPDDVKTQQEHHETAVEHLQDATNLKTPFTEMVSRLVLPLSFLVAISHIVIGGRGPGDGFTAGAIAGLVTALWFVVFGYQEARERLQAFAPHRLLRAGLIVVSINAILPIIFGWHGGTFLAHVDYAKMWGFSDFLHEFGLELTSGVIFEIGIALTVFGGIGIIMEAIAHPTETRDFAAEDENPSAGQVEGA